MVNFTEFSTIERINAKRPRNKATTSVEHYYRELLFNFPDTMGNFKVGGTIYTTLEPCPFCTAALLVNRMKRIVYIIPDAAYGGAYQYLKERFYDKYDINYSALSISTDWDSPLIANARNIHQQILKFVTENPKQIATLYLDNLQALLKKSHVLFSSLSEGDLQTDGSEKSLNQKTLSDLQKLIYG